MTPRPFEVSPADLESDLGAFVDITFADLQSSFLVIPKGDSFVEYPRFRTAYETLKRRTEAFRDFSVDVVWSAVEVDSLVFVVVRTILGMTPPELAELAAVEKGSTVTQGAARNIDKSCRRDKDYVSRLRPSRSAVTLKRMRDMVEVACGYIAKGAPAGASDTVHRLNKLDTVEGLESLRFMADHDAPYPALLYERYLGRPYAFQRDANSELVGEAMEGAVESRLHDAGVSARKTKRAEKVPGFDQAPDFIIPDEVSPEVVIEAKITNDDGTARDKVTRILYLAELGRRRAASHGSGFQTVACIDGRGFGIRRRDMENLLLQLGGKVFTLNTLDALVEHTEIHKFVTKL